MNITRRHQGDEVMLGENLLNVLEKEENICKKMNNKRQFKGLNVMKTPW